MFEMRLSQVFIVNVRDSQLFSSLQKQLSVFPTSGREHSTISISLFLVLKQTYLMKTPYHIYWIQTLDCSCSLSLQRVMKLLREAQERRRGDIKNVEEAS